MDSDLPQYVVLRAIHGGSILIVFSQGSKSEGNEYGSLLLESFDTGCSLQRQLLLPTAYTSVMSSVRREPISVYSLLYLTRLSTGFPDPFAVATIGGEQTRTTSVIKKTLNPYWNESFDM